MGETRIEKDALGEVPVPAHRLWGAQTQRSIDNFPIGVTRFAFGRPVIRAFGVVKQAAARANAGLGVLALKNIPQSLSLRGASNSPPQPPRAWLTYATGRLAADFNVEHPAQNATFQLFTSAPTMVGVGLFRNPIDLNGDAIPDSCQCPADLDGDGIVGPIDLALVIGAWGSDGIGDITGDGVVSADDLGSLLGAWGPC